MQEFVSPKLRGIRLPAEIAAWVENVVGAIRTHTKSEDKILAVPHLALFYWLAERQPSGHAPISYFDVCPDSVARADADRILHDPPKIIVWQEFPEEWNRFHEHLFRGGEPSGQRDLAAALNALRGQYRELVPALRHGQDPPIQVLVRD